MARANPYENDCAERFLATLGERSTANTASKYFEIPGVSATDMGSVGTALSILISNLGGISQMRPLPSMPEGRTAKVQIVSSVPEAQAYLGSAFEALSGRDGKVILFVSQRSDHACSIFSFELHLPDSLPHYQEIATKIAQTIDQTGRRPILPEFGEKK